MYYREIFVTLQLKQLRLLLYVNNNDRFYHDFHYDIILFIIITTLFYPRDRHRWLTRTRLVIASMKRSVWKQTLCSLSVSLPRAYIQAKNNRCCRPHAKLVVAFNPKCVRVCAYGLSIRVRTHTFVLCTCGVVYCQAEITETQIGRCDCDGCRREPRAAAVL